MLPFPTKICVRSSRHGDGSALTAAAAGSRAGRYAQPTWPVAPVVGYGLAVQRRRRRRCHMQHMLTAPALRPLHTLSWQPAGETLRCRAQQVAGGH
jgi:hypothetical protein